MKRLSIIFILLCSSAWGATCGPTGARVSTGAGAVNTTILSWTSTCTTGANALGWDVQSMLVDLPTGAGNIQVAIYSDTGWTTTAARLCLSGSQAAVNNDNTVNFAGCHLAQNLIVHFAFETDNSTTRLGYNSATATTAYYSSQTYGTFPNPLGVTSTAADTTPRMYLNLTASTPTGLSGTLTVTGTVTVLP